MNRFEFDDGEYEAKRIALPPRLIAVRLDDASETPMRAFTPRPEVIRPLRFGG